VDAQDDTNSEQTFINLHVLENTSVNLKIKNEGGMARTDSIYVKSSF